ncbi:MAG: hypothetical protein HYW33_02945 [Candidatus Blackburnbacteria bacterium]|nr:hypothetical protein [Candidatus Blackburnbacteria bacterium]
MDNPPSKPRFSNISKIVYLSTFFAITPITIAVGIFTLTLISQKPTLSSIAQASTAVNIKTPSFGSQVYAAIPDPVGKIAGAATFQDGRVEIIRQYLKKYDSPLLPYADQIVAKAEEYGIDFRLLVAIAQQESNLCKKIPENSFNCWGWGVHSRGTLKFQNYSEAIDTITKGLKTNYLDKGYTTPEEIMKKYTPSSPGTWAFGVNQFLGDME